MDWNMQAIYHPLRGMKWLRPRLDNSSQGGYDPGNDSRAAPSHELGAAEEGACARPQLLAVAKTQSMVTFVGPWDSPRRIAVDVNHGSLEILVHTEMETV